MKTLHVGHESIYTHILIFSKMLKEQILSYKQCHVCNDIYLDICFEIERGEMNMHQNTKHAARKTQIDRQSE